MTKVDECFKKKLLVKSKPSKELANFHAVRALLFRDGIKERSHYCTLAYLEQTYIKKGQIPEEYLNILRALKESRQEIQYGFIIDNAMGLGNLKEYANRAEDFIKEIEGMVGRD